MKILIIVAVVLSLMAVNVAAVDTPYLLVTLFNQNPDPVEPGDSVELRFRFDNNGTSVDGLEVELLPEYPFSINEPSLKNIGSIDASQHGENAVIVKYNVLVDRNADEGDHDIHVRYRVGQAGWIRAPPFKIDIKSLEAILSIVSASSTRRFSSGSDADLNIVLKNYGKSLLRDIQVRINLDGIPLSPVQGSNEKVIENLAPGMTATPRFTLLADADAESGYYKTGVLLNYFDDSGKKHTRNSTIGLLIYDEPEFILALKETDVYTASANGEIVLSVSNVGPAEIRFMSIELLEASDYTVLSSPSVYLGNLEADDFETAEFDIATSKIDPRDVNLNVRLTYKDSLNQEIIRNGQVALPLYSISDAKRFGLVAGGPGLMTTVLTFGVQILFLIFIIFMLIDCWKNNFPTYKKILWTVVILTGIGTVLYYFIARRKK